MCLGAWAISLPLLLSSAGNCDRCAGRGQDEFDDEVYPRPIRRSSLTVCGRRGEIPDSGWEGSAPENLGHSR